MRYVVTKNFVQILGGIWMPYGARATMERNLTSYDIENIGEFTRENVSNWLDKNAGDFSSIIDFYATVGDMEIPWSKEEHGLEYSDIAYPVED